MDERKALASSMSKQVAKTDNVPSPRKLSELCSATIQTVRQWIPGTDLSPTLSLAVLRTSMVEAESYMKPNHETARAVALAVDRVCDFCVGSSISHDPRALTREYQSALQRLPPDLVESAVEKTINRWTWGNRPPMPGDILKVADAELAERFNAVIALQRAELWRRRNPLPEQPPEERETRRLAALTQATADRMTRGLDKRREDLQERTPTPPDVLAAELDANRERMAVLRAEREGTQGD